MNILLCGFYQGNNYGDALQAYMMKEYLSSNGHSSNFAFTESCSLFEDNDVLDISTINFSQYDAVIIGPGGIYPTGVGLLIDKIPSKIPVYLYSIGYNRDLLRGASILNYTSKDKLHSIRGASFRDFIAKDAFMYDIKYVGIPDDAINNCYDIVYSVGDFFSHSNPQNNSLGIVVNLSSDSFKRFGSALDTLYGIGSFIKEKDEIYIFYCVEENSKNTVDRIGAKYVKDYIKNEFGVTHINNIFYSRNLTEFTCALCKPDILLSYRKHPAIVRKMLCPNSKTALLDISGTALGMDGISFLQIIGLGGLYVTSSPLTSANISRNCAESFTSKIGY
jgi:hypothetical protein